MSDRHHSLAATVRFLIAVLVKWAQTRQYGEIRIVVQAGQIHVVHKAETYQGQLPRLDGPGQDIADRVAGPLAAVS